MPPVEKWDPQVERRRHQFGEPGVISSLEEVAKRAATGALSPRVRMWAIECLDRERSERGIKMNTDRQRAEALLRACQKKLWVPDPVGSEWIAGSHLMACDPKTDGVCFRGGDCFVEGTLLLVEGHQLLPIEHVKPGTKIWGLDRWSEVQAVKYKGVLPVDIITLNNGSEVKLTSDHHVYVLDCVEHPMLDSGEEARALPEGRGGSDGKKRWGCSCDSTHRLEKRIRVSELREGMTLPAPDRVPEGVQSSRPRPPAPWQLRVKSIERQVISLPCWDIQTDDHRVYLPEHDVTVSQCDDLVVLLSSCLLSVGIYTLIVGHSYNRARNIGHVLTAAWVNGRWMYADPSTDMPLGKCVEFTRERIYSVPNVQMLCDQHSCLVDPRRFQPEKNNFIAQGEFVGVNGIPSPVTFSWVEEMDHTVQWLGQNDEFQVDPEVLRAAQAAQRGFAATGATAGAAICVATGLGTAAAPICAAVGGWLGKNLAKVLSEHRASNAGDARYQEKLNAHAAAGEYFAELKRLRDEALARTIDGLVQFGKENGWPQANPTDVAVQLQKLGANITNMQYHPGTNKLPPGVTDFGNLGSGGPYFSGPMPCTMNMMVCPPNGCLPFRLYDVNMAHVRCIEDETNKWVGQLEIAATFLGAAILDRKAPGQINFSSPLFKMKSSKKKSSFVPVALATAGIGVVAWLLL